jgi:hypothetical protein
MPAYFRKSAKGQLEIEGGERHLPQALRSLLVLVDGKSSAVDLQRLMAGATPEALRTLLDGGYIVPTPVPRAQRGSGTTDGDSDFMHSVAPSRFEWLPRKADDPVGDEERSQLARSLARALGPAATSLVDAARAACTARELAAVVKQAQRVIANARGQDMADEFASRFGGLDAG